VRVLVLRGGLRRRQRLALESGGRGCQGQGGACSGGGGAALLLLVLL
jgi:hypothetical protein